MFDFEKRLVEISAQTILCIGDLMLDDFVYGDVSRISPEAPAPVIRVTREDVIIGGAGNVARNIASLGATCLFVGVIGDDVTGTILQHELGKHEAAIKSHLVVDPSRPTTRKLRFVSEQADDEGVLPSWATLYERWNAAYPDERFSNRDGPFRAYRRAVEALVPPDLPLT